jgi:hypothetical protein
LKSNPIEIEDPEISELWGLLEYIIMLRW